MQLSKKEAKRLQRSDDLIEQRPGDGPFPFRFVDPDFCHPLCVPIAINTHLDAHIFRSSAEMQRFHDEFMEAYSGVVEEWEGDDDDRVIDGDWDILTSGFHAYSLYRIPIPEEGTKRTSFYRVADILYISGKGTCTVRPEGIDFVATLDTLLLGNVRSVLITASGRESHMWGARFHPESGRWWYHSNHEQDFLTQKVFEKEIREVADCSAISIKQLIPDSGKANKEMSDDA